MKTLKKNWLLVVLVLAIAAFWIGKKTTQTTV